MLRHYRTRNSTTNDVCVRRDSQDVFAAMTARSSWGLALRHSPLDVELSSVTDGCWDGAGARETARPRQKSIRPAHQAVAEALRLHLAHVAAPLAFGHLLADHLAALLFERRAVVPWVGLLRGLRRSRQRDQRKQQYDHPHLSLRVVSPSREVNTHAHALVLRNFRDARA